MICGIDFGTSNTLSTVFDGEKERLITLENNAFSMPSAVFFPFEDPGNPVYGTAATQAYTNGGYGRYMKSFKRILGTPFFDRGTLFKPGTQLKFHTIIVDYLKTVKAITESQTGKVIEYVVIGTPVRLSENDSIDGIAQLKSILNDVGFTNFSFLEEPVAAAYFHKKNIPVGSYTLIADLGGGTCDFSLVYKNPQQSAALDSIATSGISIGGTDMDSAFALACFFAHIGYKTADKFKGLVLPDTLYRYAADWNRITTSLYTPKSDMLIRKLLKIAKEKGKVEKFFAILQHKKAHDVLQAIETCKIHLSESKNDTFYHKWLHEKPLHITERNLNDAIKNSITPIVQTALECLSSTQTKPHQIAQLIFTGGTSKLPILKKQLSETFKNATVIDTNTMDAVAYGLLEKAKTDTAIS